MAAAAGVAGETSERGLRLLGVRPGETLFVDGGAGGVGAVAVQMAIARAAAGHRLGGPGEPGLPAGDRGRSGPVWRGPRRTGPRRGSRACGSGLRCGGAHPVTELISLVGEASRVVTIANFAAGSSGVRVTGGGADSQPMQALAEVADLLSQNKLVIKVQTFPFDRAAEAYRISQAGHLRGKLVLVP